MHLFVREFGTPGAPVVVFLHGGRASGWSWQPVVDRMEHYHCLVPDLPQFGKSYRQGPFEMHRAADAVAELVRSRVGVGKVHVVGYSLGAQVGMQVLATEPELVDRALLCGTFVNTMPLVRPAQFVGGRLARTAWIRRAMNRRFVARQVPVPAAQTDEYRADLLFSSSAEVAHVVEASVGFTVPGELDTSETPTLFLTGAKETTTVRRRAAALAQLMPNGIDRVAIGMRHDWPLHHPDLFARTADCWLSRTALPSQIVSAPVSGRRGPVR